MSHHQHNAGREDRLLLGLLLSIKSILDMPLIHFIGLEIESGRISFSFKRPKTEIKAPLEKLDIITNNRTEAGHMAQHLHETAIH